MGDDQFRLDTQTSKGPTSTRISGQFGRAQGSDGKVTAIPSEVAASRIFPFEEPRTLIKSGRKVSLKDDGFVTIDGTQLHRVTLERSSLGINPVTKLTSTLAMDFYFDPASHLLMKTAAATPVRQGRKVKFPFVVAYGDYRKIGEVMVSFLMSETVQGEPTAYFS